MSKSEPICDLSRLFSSYVSIAHLHKIYMYIFIPKKYMTVKLSDAEKGLSTLVYWSYSLSQNKRCLKMESSEPGSSLNSSKLFTAAESESVIKYLVRLQYTTWQVNLKRWGTVAGLILLEYSYHSPRVPW